MSKWLGLSIDTSSGPLDESKLNEIEKWIIDANLQHKEVLFLKLSCSFPELTGRQHADVVMEFQDMLYKGLCSDLRHRLSNGEEKQNSIVRLLWHRVEDAKIEMLICVNGFLWKNIEQEMIQPWGSLANLIDVSWHIALSKALRLSQRRAPIVTQKEQWFFPSDVKSFFKNHNEFFFAASTLAKKVNSSAYVLLFANSQARTNTIQFFG